MRCKRQGNAAVQTQQSTGTERPQGLLIIYMFHYKSSLMSGCSADPAQAQDDSACVRLPFADCHLQLEKKRRRHAARRAN